MTAVSYYILHAQYLALINLKLEFYKGNSSYILTKYPCLGAPDQVDNVPQGRGHRLPHHHIAVVRGEVAPGGTLHQCCNELWNFWMTSRVTSRGTSKETSRVASRVTPRVTSRVTSRGGLKSVFDFKSDLKRERKSKAIFKGGYRATMGTFTIRYNPDLLRHLPPHAAPLLAFLPGGPWLRMTIHPVLGLH